MIGEQTQSLRVERYLDRGLMENVGLSLVEAERCVVDSHTEEDYSLVYITQRKCLFEHDGVKHLLWAGDTLGPKARHNTLGDLHWGKHKSLAFFIERRGR